MRITFWELLCTTVGAVLATLYFLVGDLAVGLAFVAATTVWTAARSRAIEARGVAGGYTKSEARRHLLIVFGLLLGLVVIGCLLVTAALQSWTDTREGFVAVLALAALEASLFVHLKRHSTAQEEWRIGADAETAVGEALEPLAEEGWLVEHNWPLKRGNVDHVVAGPTGVYAIETKSGRYKSRDYGQALQGALAVRAAVGGAFVTAVVCVPDAGRVADQKGNVHVVSRAHLAEWLRSRPRATVDVPSVAAALRVA